MLPITTWLPYCIGVAAGIWAHKLWLKAGEYEDE